MAAIGRERSDGKFEVEVTCDYCGARITHANEWGMFCNNDCGLEDSKASKLAMEELIGDISKLVTKTLKKVRE